MSAHQDYWNSLLRPRGFPDCPPQWETMVEQFESRRNGHSLFSVIHKRSPRGQSARVSGRKKALFLLHGYGEHSGRYSHFLHYLKDTVDWILTYDHVGHGRSEGIRGHVDHFEHYVQDALHFLQRNIDRLTSDLPETEFYLFGHSMGGLIAALAAQKGTHLPLQSVTICAPLLGVSVPVPMIKRMFAYALSPTWGSLQLPTGIDPSILSHDTEVVQAYTEDRLVHSKATPKYFTELESVLADIEDRGLRIHFPLQIILPTDDHVVSVEATRRVFEPLQSERLKIESLPGFYHEAFNEGGSNSQFDKAKPFQLLQNWITQFSNPKTAD